MQDKLYSKDLQKSIDDENKALTERNRGLQSQLANTQLQLGKEREKKKTDDEKVRGFQDEIDELNRQIEDNNRTIQENKDRRIDAIYGSDIQSAIEHFASAYADAWTDGMPSKDNLRQSVRDLLKAAALETVKADSYLQSTLENLRSNFIPSILADNIISDDELNRLNAWSDNVASDLDSKYGKLMDIFKDNELSSADTREASAKGIATASQDSVDENNARLTTIQGHTFLITENQKLLLANSNRALQHLAAIETNTFELHAVRSEMTSMRRNIDDMTLKGIKLKM